MTDVNQAYTSDPDVRIRVVKWLLLLNGNTGTLESMGSFSDRCVQVTGTFGSGGSLTMQGSNDGTTWATLTDPLGNALTFTSAGMKQITELPYYIRPNCTAGDGSTSLNVYLAMKGSVV